MLNFHVSHSGTDERPSAEAGAFAVSASPRLAPYTVRNVMLASTALVVLSFGSLGFWVANKIEESIKLDVGLRAARYMETSLSGQLQSLQYVRDLGPQAVQALSDILDHDARRLDVNETRVWSLDGHVLFAHPRNAVGERYVLTDDITEAAGGAIRVEFDQHPHIKVNGEVVVPPNRQLFEIYAPIHSETTGEVLAVAEFYQNGEEVIAAVNAARRATWMATGLACAALIAGIGFVVVRGTRLIESQRAALDHQVDELVVLLDQNEDLRRRIAKATQRGTEDHEAILRRIGSDLHDGAGQLITIVLFRLQKLFGESENQTTEYNAVRSLLWDCMTEIRHMAAGLALPEIKSLGLAAAVQSVVSRHEYRTGTTVDLALTPALKEPSHPVRLGICRMIQESLNNSFKHAGGVGQTVTVECSPTSIAVEIRDRGPGIRAKVGLEKRETLGLVGLRNRLESLGAELIIQSDALSGTALFAVFPV